LILPKIRYNQYKYKEYSIPVDQVKVKANTTQLTQVMVNLFTNAISAMNNIGTLSIKLSTEMIDTNHSITDNNINPGEYIKLSVADTGCGMDSETSARIFEPYYTTKEKGKGTGLGLSVSYDIIKEHDGAITVDTQPGKGTCFNIYLPVAEEPLDDQAEETISQIEEKPTYYLLMMKNILSS